MPVKPETIAAISSELQQTTLTPARAEELASEVGGINEAVLQTASQSFSFFDEPAHFLAVLEAHAEDFE